MQFKMRHSYFLPKPPEVMTALIVREVIALIIVLELHRFQLFSFKDSSSYSQLCLCGPSSLSGIFSFIFKQGRYSKYLTIKA